MRKPTWISFCGWATFALILFAISAALLGHGEKSPPIPAVLSVLALMLAAPCFGLWLLASIVHKFQVSGARIQARAMMETQQRMRPAAGGPGKPPTSPEPSSADGQYVL